MEFTEHMHAEVIQDQQYDTNDDEQMSTFGVQLGAMRTLRNMTQRELSLASGVTQPMITRIERGTQVPRLPTMMRLADALDAVCLVGGDMVEMMPSQYVLDARVHVLDNRALITEAASKAAKNPGK